MRPLNQVEAVAGILLLEQDMALPKVHPLPYTTLHTRPALMPLDTLQSASISLSY